MSYNLKKALRDRTLTAGAWIQIGHPAVAEIFAEAGFDWICVDLEHGHLDIESMTDLFRAMSSFDVAPLVRVPKNEDVWIKRALDAGAKGIIIPMVNSAEEARMAVACAKYPPTGSRGYGYARANRYGEDFQKYIQSANDEIAVIVQIEHKEAIDNLNEILDVPGIDGAFVGPYDLSGSYGKPGDFNDEQIQTALSKYLVLCDEKNISAGIHIVRPDGSNIMETIEKGYTFLALGIDVQYLAEKSIQVLKSVSAAGVTK